MPIILPYTDEAQWLAYRREDITSTEIAALFGESPYVTEFEIFHRKRNDVSVEFTETDRIKWGRRFEAPIAEGLAEDYGWAAKPLKVYMRHSTTNGMGSSFDYEISKNGSRGILEIKNVDFKEYKAKWIDEDDNMEAPVHIELQLQHQLEVADADFGVIAAMIGGNKPIVIERERDREIGKLMCQKITQFWADVAANKEPSPDFMRDTGIIKVLYKDTSGSEIDLSGNNRFSTLLADYPVLQKAESDAKKAKDACKAEMTTIMGSAGLAKCNGSYVTRKEIKRGSYTVAETSYIDMRIKQTKATKGEAA